MQINDRNLIKEGLDQDNKELLLNESEISSDNSHMRYYTNLKEISSIKLIPYTSISKDNGNEIIIEFPDKTIKVDLSKE